MTDDICESTCCSRDSSWLRWALANSLIVFQVLLSESIIFCFMSAPTRVKLSFNSINYTNIQWMSNFLIYHLEPYEMIFLKIRPSVNLHVWRNEWNIHMHKLYMAKDMKEYFFTSLPRWNLFLPLWWGMRTGFTWKADGLTNGSSL